MISGYGRPQSTLTGLLGLAFAGVFTWLSWWWGAGLALLGTVVLLGFFRDPERHTPTLRGQAISPADGRVSSIHEVEHFEMFGGPAVCVRIFLSVFDVHVNRSPLHGRVAQLVHKPGKKLNALKAESAELNESNTMLLTHPTHGEPVAAVRQIAGAIARNIVCGAREGDILQRGQRYGMIKYGSTTELYLPNPDRVTVQVKRKEYVYGGKTVLAMVEPIKRDVPDGVADLGGGVSAGPEEVEVGADG
ncbi:MAG: phosphatidylserine decarboxylase [Planctomycetota bacterium]|jgi:phosphatidylserine decarboxylase